MQQRRRILRPILVGHASNRAQYLRIKGLALAEACEMTGARELWLRVLHDTGEFAALEHAGALEHLADSYTKEDPSAAEHYYRRLLVEHPDLNGTTTMQQVPSPRSSLSGALPQT
jgi:hypothetical protein